MKGKEKVWKGGGKVRKNHHRGTDCYKYENMQKGERSNGGGSDGEGTQAAGAIIEGLG